MSPHGLALRDHLHGDAAASLVLCRDDGLEIALPTSWFFRPPEEFTPVESAALERCRGHVLDVGAGAGIHALVLQQRGLAVTALDVCPEAVLVLRARGVRDVHQADAFAFEGGPFDTLLMLGHGIGMVEDPAGLDRFLAHARGLLRPDGRLLVDSNDPTRSADPRHRAYHEANRRAGRHPGEVRLRFVYGEVVGPWCRWLHVDPPTLRARAQAAGWSCDVALALEQGDYLAELRPSG